MIGDGYATPRLLDAEHQTYQTRPRPELENLLVDEEIRLRLEDVEEVLAEDLRVVLKQEPHPGSDSNLRLPQRPRPCSAHSSGRPDDPTATWTGIDGEETGLREGREGDHRLLVEYGGRLVWSGSVGEEGELAVGFRRRHARGERKGKERGVGGAGVVWAELAKVVQPKRLVPSRVGEPRTTFSPLSSSSSPAQADTRTRPWPAYAPPAINSIYQGMTRLNLCPVADSLLARSSARPSSRQNAPPPDPSAPALLARFPSLGQLETEATHLAQWEYERQLEDRKREMDLHEAVSTSPTAGRDDGIGRRLSLSAQALMKNAAAGPDTVQPKKKIVYQSHDVYRFVSTLPHPPVRSRSVAEPLPSSLASRAIDNRDVEVLMAVRDSNIKLLLSLPPSGSRSGARAEPAFQREDCRLTFGLPFFVRLRPPNHLRDESR